MYGVLARSIFHAWPFRFGHVKVMEALNPPKHPDSEVTTVLRRYGLQFSYDPNSYIGRYIWYRGIFEEQILRTIEGVLQPGDTFVDVGANIGVHCLVAAHLVGVKGQVLAFEPQSACRARLLRNAQLNGITNVTLSPHAVGRAPAQARIYAINPRNDGQSTLWAGKKDAPSEEISVITLDSLNVPSCILKIDVEGAEMEVLAGAERTLRERRARHIFIEVIDEYQQRFTSSRGEVMRCLSDAGYALKGLIRGRWIPVSATTPADMDVWAIAP